MSTGSEIEAIGLMKNHFDVAFDISFLPTTGGLGTYTAQSLKNFIHYDSGRNYLLLENEIASNTNQFRQREINWKTRWKPFPPNWHYEKTSRRSRIMWMLFDLPKQIEKYKPRIFHSLDNVTVPKKVEYCATVLILHDMIPISHPHFCRWRDALMCRWLIGRAVYNSTKIITVSNYSAEQIMKYYPEAKEKIEIVKDGVDHNRYYPISDRENMAENLRQKYLFYSSKFILLVTTLSPRRNLVRFLKAYAKHLKQTQDWDTCVVVAGCRGWKDQDVFHTIQKLCLITRVHFLDYVPDDELVRLFQAAFAVAQPSLLEGFGLVVLEAMACGTPVLCSSTTALGETAGDAALKMDPYDVNSMAKAIGKIVNESTLRKELSEKGIEHAQQYSWVESTKNVIEIFNSLLHESSTE